MALLLNRSQKRASNVYSRKYLPENTTRLRPVRGAGPDSAPGNSFMGILRWLMGIGLSTVLLFGLVVGLMYAYRALTTSEYFTIRTITINGAKHADRATLLRAAGLQEGMNSLAVNIADVERALRKSPWVANISVKRHLPDRFEIDVEERMPAFWVLKDDGLVYADSKGNFIAPVEAENFLSLPSLELENGGEMLIDKLDDFVKALGTTVFPLEIGTASWLRLSAARGFELFLEQHGLALSIGVEGWEDNLRRIGMVLNDLARRGEIKSAREIWAADGSVWVRKDEDK